MTTTQFLAEIKRAGLRFLLKPDRTIRTRCGMCPIEALAHERKLMPLQFVDSGSVWSAGKRLGMKYEDIAAVICASDYTVTQMKRSILRSRYAPVAKGIRESLLELVDTKR